MKIYYDQDVDAAYIRLSEEQPTGVVEVSEGVNLDITEDGKMKFWMQPENSLYSPCSHASMSLS